jgi:predicted lipoprotein with Yx(FWY)xxD motif
MRKNSSMVIIGIIVVIILMVGGFAIFHKSPKTTPTNTTTAQTKAAAVNNAILTTKTDPTLGQYLAGPNGALYTYGGDTSGVSNCSGACLANWPPYQATGSTTNLPAGVTTIKRSDNGETQYAYNGMPLYYFSSDSAGKVTGNGVSNFHIATPAAASSAQSTTTTTPAGSSSTSSPNYNY